jgi:hypothetical protein
LIREIPADTGDSSTTDETSSSTDTGSTTKDGTVVTPAGPSVKPSEFDTDEVKPKKPKINVATGETEEQTKKVVTLDSYKPAEEIEIGGKKFELPVKKLIIEDDSPPPPPLPERKVAPAEDVANLFTEFRESYMVKRKAKSKSAATGTFTAGSTSGSTSSAIEGIPGGLDFADASEAVAPTVVEEEEPPPPPPEISVPPGGISRDGSIALGGNGNMAVPPFDENQEGQGRQLLSTSDLDVQRDVMQFFYIQSD